MEHRWESVCLFQTLSFQFSLATVHALSSFIIESDAKYPVGDCEAEGLVEPLSGSRELDPHLSMEQSAWSACILLYCKGERSVCFTKPQGFWRCLLKQ